MVNGNIKIPFGLKNASPIIQRMSGIIRRNGLEGFCINYIDELLKLSKIFEEHLEDVEALIKAILRRRFSTEVRKM